LTAGAPPRCIRSRSTNSEAECLDSAKNPAEMGALVPAMSASVPIERRSRCWRTCSVTARSRRGGDRSNRSSLAARRSSAAHRRDIGDAEARPARARHRQVELACASRRSFRPQAEDRPGAGEDGAMQPQRFLSALAIQKNDQVSPGSSQ